MSFLDNVPEQNVFILSDGSRIHNLEELYIVISSSDESVFYNHVTNDRNDFANWIRYVIHHEEFYNKIIAIKDRRQFMNILASEIEFIKNPKLKETAAFFSENFDSEMSSSDRMSSSESKSVIKSAVPVSVHNNVSVSVPDIVSDMFKPVENEQVGSNQVNSLLTPEKSNDDSGLAFSDFEQVLSVIIAEINNEIFSWNE